MTSRGRALIYCVLAVMSAASPCRAGIWASEPSVGFIGDYSTNPALLDTAYSNAETRAALLLDAPTAYHGDAFQFLASPHLRIGDSPGYSSLTSNYEHLDLRAEYDTELSSFDLSGGLANDSSLYHDFILDGSAGVQRKTINADFNWNRRFTERISFDTDVSTSRVRYGESTGTAILTDYTYTNIAPTFSWDESEKGKFTASGDAGLYKSSDGTTRSRNFQLQLGFVRHLTELWSVTATAGYSRAFDEIDTFREVLVFIGNQPAIELVPITVKSTQNGTVFSLNLSRQASLLLVSATASRQLVPSGFAFLSRQQSYELSLSYPYSSRWTVSGGVRYLKSQDPSQNGATTDRAVRYASLSSAWRWTERWTVTVSAARVMETIQSAAVNPSSTELSIQLSRQFNRITF